MKRRDVLAGGVGALCLGAVGATQALQVDSIGRDRGERFDVDDGEAGGAGEAHESDGGSEEDGDGSEPAMAATLEILSTAAGETPVSLQLRRLSDAVVVHDRVRTFSYGERAYLSGLCASGEAYAFQLAVDGTTLVDATIEPGDTAIYELTDETTVSVIA